MCQIPFNEHDIEIKLKPLTCETNGGKVDEGNPDKFGKR
jgi:hypothetical protein